MALKVRGALLYGKYPRWSPNGESIVWLKPSGVNYSVAVHPIASDTVLTLFDSPRNTVLDDLDLYHNRLLGNTSYLFLQINGPGAGPYLIEATGVHLRRFPYVLGNFDRIGPDGQHFVRPGVDPKDGVAVIYVGRFDDFSGSGVRQLTIYTPPASLPDVAADKEAPQWSLVSPSVSPRSSWPLPPAPWSLSGHRVPLISH